MQDGKWYGMFQYLQCKCNKTTSWGYVQMTAQQFNYPHRWVFGFRLDNLYHVRLQFFLSALTPIPKKKPKAFKNITTLLWPRQLSLKGCYVLEMNAAPDRRNFCLFQTYRFWWIKFHMKRLLLQIFDCEKHFDNSVSVSLGLVE